MNLQKCLSINISDAEQLHDFYITVTNEDIGDDLSSRDNCAFEDKPFMPSETRVYTCINPSKGRYVRVMLHHFAEYLQLCEVQVQGDSSLSFRLFFLFSIHIIFHLFYISNYKFNRFVQK